MSHPNRGPRKDRPTDDPAEAIGERRFRALAEPLDVRWVARDPYPALEVRNPVRKTRYLTVWPGFPDREPGLCTCSDFARRGLGDCKHLEAAWRWLSGPAGRASPVEGANPEGPSPAAVWEAIDQRLHDPPPLRERDIRQLSVPGQVLISEAASV